MIGVISKPGSDENKLFEIHSQFLQENGIRVPKVEAFDHQKGFMILEDFGDKVLQLEINSKNKASFYQKSIMAIHKIQKCKPCLLYTSPSPRDVEESRMPSSA